MYIQPVAILVKYDFAFPFTIFQSCMANCGNNERTFLWRDTIVYIYIFLQEEHTINYLLDA